MTLTINLTSASGVNFNADFDSFFAATVPSGWPYILGGNSQFSGDQIVLLDQIQTGNEANTKTIVLDGANFNYYFNDHTLSGLLTTVRLGTLGDSYNPQDGSFDIVNGHIANISTFIEISGLDIFNAYRTRGDFHETIYGLMGGGHGAGAPADPTVLKTFIWAEGHLVNGSAGADTYSGTKFADTIYGNGGNDILRGNGGNDRIFGGQGNDTLRGGTGNDILNGAAGNDKLYGDDGNDRLFGGVGADSLYGGAGKDTFIFKSITESTVLASGRDTIFDFSSSQADVIDLSAIDANVNLAGDQAFTFIGDAKFSKAAGELRYVQRATDAFIYADVDGDGVADFAVRFATSISFSASDFIL